MYKLLLTALVLLEATSKGYDHFSSIEYFHFLLVRHPPKVMEMKWQNAKIEDVVSDATMYLDKNTGLNNIFTFVSIFHPETPSALN